MNYEEKVLTLVREGNPIPDPDRLDVDTAQNAVYLATLEQRSSEVTQLDTKRPGQKERGRSPMLWLAAAATVIVLGVALILMSQGNEEVPVVTEPTPTTLVESTPTTVTEETPTTVTDLDVGPFEGEWDFGATTIRFEGDEYTILQAGVHTDWGTWTSDQFTIMFQSSSDTEVCSEGAMAIVDYSFEGDPNTLGIAVAEDECGDRGLGSIPTEGPQQPTEYSKLGTATTGDPEWDSEPVFISPRSESLIEPGEYRTARFRMPFQFTLAEGWVSYIPQSANSVSLSTNDQPELNIIFKLFEETTVDDTVTSFTSRAELGASSPIPITIAGAQGVIFDIEPQELVTVFNDENGAFPAEPGDYRIQIAVVDVAGRPVTIIIGHPADGEAQFAAMGQPLLDSIIWKESS